MGHVQSRRQAVALSRFDLPDAHDLLLHSCEDCACAVTDDEAVKHQSMPSPPVASAGDRWVCASEVAEFPLDAEHRLLFNPLGSSGAVVVNESAYDIFRAFGAPAVPGDVVAGRPGRGAEFEEIFRRLSSLELLHPDGRKPRPRFPDGQVLTAWLHVTNGCNLRCPYCYVHKSAQAMDEATGRAAVEAVFGSAVANGFPAVKLKYAGGEASLNHRLVVSLHAYARELAAAAGVRLYATLLSNGVRLPASLVQTCKAEGIRVMISLDGLGDQHDVQRPFANGKPSFQFVERTIAELLRQGLPPHLSVTITSRNASGVADVVRFALERDLTFSLNLFRDNDCASVHADLRYEEQAMIASLLAAFGVVEDFLPRWSVLGSILDRGQLLQPRQRSCGVGQDYVVIDQRGQVAKCHMEIEKTLGDVFADDPLALVRQDRTSALNLLVDEKAGCRDCTWRYWCSGGCTVATFRATGRYDIKSPNCHIYQAIYPQALRLEGLRLLKYAVT
ncbi:MAG TPA: radical SAM protein [Streptosporangiaceae bacterium]|nr:radical SAM protein [Streptosporangiaceae bacterium]